MNARVPLLALALAVLLAAGSAGAAEPRRLSMEEALELSMDNAESLRIKAQAVQKSRCRLVEARAKGLPSLSLETAFSYLTNPPEGITVARGKLGSLPLPFPPGTQPLPDRDIVFLPDTEHTYFSLSASLKQPIYTWGKIKAGVRLAALEMASSRSELELEKRIVARETQKAYAGALSARLSLPVLVEMCSSLRSIVVDRQRSFEEGLGTRQALLEAKAGLAAAERRLLEAREAESSALESLRLLTSLEAVELDLTTPLRGAPGAMPAEQELLKRALARSGELELARTRIAQAQEKSRLERGGGLLRPDLSLNVSLEVTGQKPPWTARDWTDTWNWDLILSLGTRVKLFDGGEARARLEGSRSDLTMASYGAAQAEKLVRLGVRQAVAEARRAAGEMSELEAQLAAAAEHHRIIQLALQNSMASREELNYALLALNQRRLELLSARRRMELALIELEWLAGPLS